MIDLKQAALQEPVLKLIKRLQVFLNIDRMQTQLLLTSAPSW